MVVVAVAGTGGVGRTVLDAIAKAGKHTAIVLSRTAAPDSPNRFAVDYGNVDSIARVLQENSVEVVISALLLSDEAASQSQINLIRAAAQSGTVNRFLPSEYYIDYHLEIPGSKLFSDYQIANEEEVARHPELTHTMLRTGIFLDHLTMPFNPKPTYITPFYVFVDLSHEEIVIPGDGAHPLNLTHSTDLAAFIERLCGLPAEDWPPACFVQSNRLQPGDLPALVKRATGKDFKVTYDSEEAIREGKITPLPSNEAVFADPRQGDQFREVELQIMLSMFSRAHELPGKDLAEIFPDVRVTEAEEFFKAGWELKQRMMESKSK